ncbi:uncharacterized protein LY79DRAFT_557327 [Colletotrichum navitas]|uniref:Uncharacterized protein n=1 Tax=Colletotrichum navitas TaxID=681940 RepID=A0AAD8PYG5_9PEZI|nr:uncharacterized protein LY79DRAFT_557327 [Colletotrichum navitas]KAK1586038.1 hypothetical protein LY79DRAFT_557327 [Colletotrichum navitas]
MLLRLHQTRPLARLARLRFAAAAAARVITEPLWARAGSDVLLPQWRRKRVLVFCACWNAKCGTGKCTHMAQRTHKSHCRVHVCVCVCVCTLGKLCMVYVPGCIAIATKPRWPRHSHALAGDSESMPATRPSAKTKVNSVSIIKKRSPREETQISSHHVRR